MCQVYICKSFLRSVRSWYLDIQWLGDISERYHHTVCQVNLQLEIFLKSRVYCISVLECIKTLNNVPSEMSSNIPITTRIENRTKQMFVNTAPLPFFMCIEWMLKNFGSLWTVQRFQVEFKTRCTHRVHMTSKCTFVAIGGGCGPSKGCVAAVGLHIRLISFMKKYSWFQ